MGYGIVVWIAAVMAQAPEQAGKAAAPQAKPAVKPGANEDASARWKEARRLLLNGRYAEAEEMLKSIGDEAKKSPGGLSPALRVTVALDEAECRASQGEIARAIDGLKAAEAVDAKNADLPARLADLYLSRGDWEAAEAAMRRAEKLDADNLQARWALARLLELRGDLEKAMVAYKWFVDRYNEKKPEIVASAEALVLVGQAAERYYRASARGEELSDALNDVMNDIYEAALRVDPNCWQAPMLEGRLFSRATRSERPSRSCRVPSRSTRWRPRCW